MSSSTRRRAAVSPPPNLDFLGPAPQRPAGAPAVVAGAAPVVPVPAVDVVPVQRPPVAEPAAADVPVPAPAAAGPAVEDVPAAVVQAPSAAGPAVPRRKKRRRRVTNPADDGTGVSLPIALVERLRDYCAGRRGATYTGVTLDAVEATHARLAELLAPALPAPRQGPLFAGRAPRRSAVHGTGHQQVNLRFGDDDLAVIDEMWPRVGAPSRSAMLAAALDAYLPQREGAGQSLADAAQA